MITYNANLSKEGKPIDVTHFLPYPQSEIKEKDKLKIADTSLNYLKKNKKLLPLFVRVALDKYL